MLAPWKLLLLPLWAAEPLPEGGLVERPIAPGRLQQWSLPSTPGYFEIDVTARGTRLQVDGPGLSVGLMDAPMRPVRLCWVRHGGPPQTLRIRSLEDVETRSYAVTLHRRKMSEQDPERVEGCRQQLASRATLPLPERLAALTAARVAFEKAGDRRGVAEVLTPTGAVLWELGRQAEALATHRQAVAAWELLGDTGRQAEAMAMLGAGYQLTPGRSADGTSMIRRAIGLAMSAGDTVAECRLTVELVASAATSGGPDVGRTQAHRAIQLAKAAGDRATEAALWNSLARIEFNSSLATAVRYDSAALDLRRRLKDEAAVAQSLNNLATGLRGLGEVERADAMMQEALEIRRRVAPPNAVANTLHNIGVNLLQSGEFDRAVAVFEEALGIWRSTGYKAGEAATLTELATTFFRRGAGDRAERLYRQALELHRGLNNRRAQANALAMLAGILHARGAFAESARVSKEAAGIAREGMFRLERARALHALGRAYLSMDRIGEALAELAAARESATGVSRIDLGTVLTTTGSALRRAGDLPGSLGAYTEARMIAEMAEDQPSLAGIHSGAALTLLAMGDTARAMELSEKAVAALEDARSKLAHAGTRAEFLARRQEIFKAAVAIRIRAGNPAAALDMSEKGRARSLSDLLAAMHVATPANAAGAEEKKLRNSLSAKSAALARMRIRNAPAGEMEKLRKQVAAQQDEYRTLLERLARDNPDLARASSAPHAAQIQAALAPDEALLEFSLGADGCYLWIARRDGIQATSLGPAAAIEATADDLRAALRADGNPAPALAKLDSLLFRAVAAELAAVRRLYVVPDGGLHLVPFAAFPSLGAKPLAILPSAGFLTLPRGARWKGPVAVFADPVYEIGDDRFRLEVSGTRGASESLRFARLRFSAKEAQAIARMAPLRTAAEGFAANRAAVLNGSLARFGVVHFAAHAVVDQEQPEQSALVLSLYDERGRATDGFVRMYDVSRLRLNSPLVVLSACETAVGQTLAGEGPLALSRAFLAAGASGVVASLWAVDDAATAEFMAAFYEALLRNGQPVAQALRYAQRRVRSQARWANPYYWAGFTYTGN
ncbi:MAG: CHAT domain-containing protein [Bryobacterales bacterium]|nr:CHAT domain-containing protein [Bryobacterales bacterium]